MLKREIHNMISGIFVLAIWAYLSSQSPEHSIQIAVGGLLSLLGFAGRDTIIDILKHWNNNN